MRHGYLLIDKPTGPTSHDIVSLVRRKLGERHIGHLGTLDPAASGLLVLAVGQKALKTLELFQHTDKSYEADVELGKVSTTYDREGIIETVDPKPGWEIPLLTNIVNTINDFFLGNVQQVPPAYSAVKIGGERAYRKMRQGLSVQLPARAVNITECTVLRYAYPHLSLQVTCGSGTYIRSLAHDLGKKLRCGGYLSGLRRTRVGPWLIAASSTSDQCEWHHILPLKEALRPLPAVTLTEQQCTDIRHGRSIALDLSGQVIAWYEDCPVAILIPKAGRTGTAHPRKVL